MASMRGEPGGKIDRSSDVSDDEKAIDQAVKGVLAVFKDMKGQTYDRIPLRELIAYVLEDNDVEKSRIERLVEPVFNKLRTLDDPVIQQQITKEEEAEKNRSREPL